MNAIEPETIHDNATRIVFAKNQPEYQQLPAAIDDKGLVLTEWEFSAEDMAKIVNGGRLRLWLLTFNGPLQPVALEVVEA
jgi:hypothetical protein